LKADLGIVVAIEVHLIPDATFEVNQIPAITMSDQPLDHLACALHRWRFF